MILTASTCIYCGIETLGRVADVLSIIFFLMIISVIVISLPYIDFTNFQPVFVRGTGPIIRGALTPIALISQIWILGMIVPVTNNPKKTLIISLTSVGLSLAILILVSIITVGVLGPAEAARSNFPLLYLIRSVKLSEFFQRTEALVMLSWGFGLFVSISAFLYGGARGLSQLLNLKDYRTVIWPISVLWLFMSIQCFEDIFEFHSFLKPKTFAPYGLFLLLLPLILLWGSYFFKNSIDNI